MAQDLACVPGLPRFAGSLGRVLLVQADEQVDQLAAYRPGAQQVRQLGQVDEPLRVPGGPVIVGPVDDPENTVVSLGRLMQQGADLLRCVRHLVPPVHWVMGRQVAARPWLLSAVSTSYWQVSVCAASPRHRASHTALPAADGRVPGLTAWVG